MERCISSSTDILSLQATSDTNIDLLSGMHTFMNQEAPPMKINNV